MATEAQPVRSLTEHAKALEAAISVCLADPKKKAVHKLRSQTRRVEAQLLLLRQMRDLPAFRTEARELERELRKVRRAAGRVRDLDVHDELLSEFLSPGVGGGEHGEELRAEAERMRADETERRDRFAAKLVDLLRDRQAKLTGSTEAVLAALKPADELRVPAAAVLEIAEKAFRRVAGPDKGGAARAGEASKPAKKVPRKRREQQDEHLHDLRKAAKAVRYMAEAAPRSVRAKEFAKNFEALQESGGQWHDWLEMAGEAREVLGARHALTRLFKERRDRHRTGFLLALQHRGVR